MVAADWRRTVLAPAAMPCLKTHLLKELGKDVSFVRFRRVLFPPVATESLAYVLLVDVKSTTGKARVAVEIVLVGRGLDRADDHLDGAERGAEGDRRGRRAARQDARRPRDLTSAGHGSAVG